MRIGNPFKINDWPINKFLNIVISFQLLFWGTICLDSIGLKVPILRQFICFIYLSFIPGILTLRVLKLHKLDSVENFLYSIGLSITILMFTGLFINIFFPAVGIKTPISTIPLVFSISLIVLMLCFLCYILDKGFSEPDYIDLEDAFFIPALFLCLIPLLTVLGTYLMNIYKINLLLMVVIFFISLIIILVYLNVIPHNLYCLAIYVASLSLVFHRSLISMYLVGWDIQTEYHMANNVIINSLWNPSISYSNINSTLSIAFLAPIYSILCNLSITWVFKIIYPLIFSLAPLGLYTIFKKQTNNKLAFMSVFFFISFYVFYTELVQLARQQIAEYFFVLLMLLIFQKKHRVSDSFLLVLFSFSMIVSHYGLSYIFMGLIICNFFTLYMSSKYFMNTSSRSSSAITLTFTLLFSVSLIAWYVYVSNSSVLYSIVNIITNILNNFISDFLNPDTAQGMYVILKDPETFPHKIYKYLHILTQFFISVGLFYTIQKRGLLKHFKFNSEYLSLCIVFYILLLAGIVVPNFSNALNTSRLYQITLLLLSPFCVIGGVIALKLVLKKVLRLNERDSLTFSFGLLSLFFALFLLFNTGWIFEMLNDSPTSFSLNDTIDLPKFNEQSMKEAEWLYQTYYFKDTDNKRYIYADNNRFILLRFLFESKYIKLFPAYVNQMDRDSYLYLSTYNIHKNKILVPYQANKNALSNYINLDPYVSSKNKIYNNGGGSIYYQ